MCDDLTVQANEEYLAQKDTEQGGEKSGISRRTFGQLSAGAAALAMLPPVANAQEVVEQDVKVPMGGGEMSDCYFVHPSSGQHPAIVFWPDIMSIRPAFREMGKRLAQSGYSVLVVNPYYRTAVGRITPEGMGFNNPEIREILLPHARTLSPETCVLDGRDYVSWLDAQDSVDTSRKVGTAGYCMTGSYVIRMAADMPDRVGAGASFHGGGLASDSPASPHLLAGKVNAGLLIAIAQNDDEGQPEAKDILRESFGDAGVSAEIEVYPAQHGWCPLDSYVYDDVQAERAWSRMLNLFETELA